LGDAIFAHAAEFLASANTWIEDDEHKHERDVDGVSRAADIPVELTWPPAPRDPQLAANEVHVWAIRLEQPLARRANFAATLSPDESERANRFHFERDRNGFTVARGSLRSILGIYIGLSPAEIRFEYGARGKPSLASKSAPSPVHFNLAHSGGLALVAVTRVADIGVDVEQIRRVDDVEAIAKRFFSPRESAILRGLSQELMQAAFFNLWTRKEAWLKATGEGIGESLNQVEVSCLPEEPARFITLFGDEDLASQWRLVQLTPAKGYVGALTIQESDIEARCWGAN